MEELLCEQPRYDDQRPSEISISVFLFDLEQLLTEAAGVFCVLTLIMLLYITRLLAAVRLRTVTMACVEHCEV